MRRKLTLLALIWGATVLLMALQKPIFLLYYAEQAAQHSFGEWMQVIWHGLKLDMTVAGYITALPILLTLCTCWIPLSERAGRRLLNGYFGVVSALVALLFAVDLGLYEFWGFRLDSTILIYLSDPKEAAASVDLWTWVRQTLLALLYGALLIAVYRRIVRRYDATRPQPLTALAWSLVLLLVAGLDFLAIRGGVGASVANVSKVCFSSKLFLNHAATNPIFSFLSTLGKQENYADEYPFYTTEELATRFEAIRGNQPATQPADTLLRTPRPNVLFIVLESIGTTVLEGEENGQPVMPHLQALRDEGIYFKNLYANSFRTDRGQIALLSGFPAQTRISLMKLTTKCRELPSIARSMGREGYTTQFIYGGDLNFTNQASYMYATGWQQLYWQKDMSLDAPTIFVVLYSCLQS
ncbi:MAG: sulfatase-like hydrolase/transferase [Alistipes sp.]|nr:sulfatase-like hydrolase/transferase [Alistipes sp.]